MEIPVLEMHRLSDVHLDANLHVQLGDPAHQRALRFAKPGDREEFVAGRLALLNFAASLLDVNPNRLTSDYRCPQCGPGQDHGRPGFMLDGGPAPLALSASRASGWVLLSGVVHPTEDFRLGVDLEAVGRVGFVGFDDLALTGSEKRFLASIPDRDQATLRARLWARKEAWLKMIGEGLRHNPAELDVLDRPGLRDVTERELPAGQPRGLVAALALD
ncbi:4'-phosphopantetheinyl transferase family protein [Paenarthrobacter sp. NPDC057981]|uniref:4'-phosphopantetheinyl transferase family protein n=1 Tax=Paenarthrobacter sp. NPDC057981 TaxID=3346297 RepID=UPI0036D84A07